MEQSTHIPVNEIYTDDEHKRIENIEHKDLFRSYKGDIIVLEAGRN